jgi:hypothetical protein
MVVANVADIGGTLPQTIVPSTGISTGLPQIIKILGEIRFQAEIYLRALEIDIRIDAGVPYNYDFRWHIKLVLF